MAAKTTAVAKNKPKFTVRVKTFLRGVWLELKKVNWPTKKQLMTYTAVVLVTVLVMALVLWIADSLLTLGMEGLMKLGH
ncbi:MAG: preprotein translocase subunit SecE [Clostridiales bacterium]